MFLLTVPNQLGVAYNNHALTPSSNMWLPFWGSDRRREMASLHSTRWIRMPGSKSRKVQHRNRLLKWDGYETI